MCAVLTAVANLGLHKVLMCIIARCTFIAGLFRRAGLERYAKQLFKNGVLQIQVRLPLVEQHQNVRVSKSKDGTAEQCFR